MRMRPTLLALLAAMPGAARADMTAIYGVPGKPIRMVIQIAANGDVHGGFTTTNKSFTTRGGHGYFIEPGPTGPIVTRAEDVATVMAEKMAKLDPRFRQQVTEHPPVLQLVRKGVATINGRSGDAYYIRAPNGALSPVPNIVISHDPALAPLGRAMAGQFEMSMQGLSKTMSTASFAQIIAALHTGAPIVFTGAQLMTVIDRPIPASVFALPAAPLPLAQVRARMLQPQQQQRPPQQGVQVVPPLARRP